VAVIFLDEFQRSDSIFLQLRSSRQVAVPVPLNLWQSFGLVSVIW